MQDMSLNPATLRQGEAWRDFNRGRWETAIDVRDFIVRNVTPYDGDESFLAAPSNRTMALWDQLRPYFTEERQKGVLDTDAATPSSILAHGPGYIDRVNEVIVGLQTDKPFRRAIFPCGGLRMVEAGLKAAGFEPDPAVHQAFTHYRKTHNDGVFDAYTPEILRCRRSSIITGLPDAYGRGRIIGDYRRVALYGVDRLVEVKHEERAQLDDMWPTDDVIRSREELAEQIRALNDLAEMGRRYDCDISRPAESARQAVQWTYLAYLGAIKEANGAAMSIGRISTFLDIYISRDLTAGVLDEAGAQELIDQLVQKLRIVRFLLYARLRCAVQRGPILGDRMYRRHDSRRTNADHAHQLPDAAYAHQPRSGSGTEYDRALVTQPARSVQALLHLRQPRHLGGAV